LEVQPDGQSKTNEAGKLAEKLLKIRESLGFSQSEMVDRLGYTDSFTRNYISAFELGTREPPLPVLLAYARIIGVSTDVLIDDNLEFSEKFSTKPKHHPKNKEGYERKVR
jgi:transcriptional regulator with XRE-family HTH domain